MDNFNQTTPQQNESQPVNHQGNKVVHICKFCGAAISKEEKTCPNCGAKNKKPIFKRAWFWIIIVVIVLFAIIIGSSGGDDNGGTGTAVESSNTNSSTLEESSYYQNSYITESSTLVHYNKTTENVVKGYESAISYAKKNGYEADYAYNNVRDRLVKLNSAAYMDDTDEVEWQAWALFSGDWENLSTRQLQLKAQDMLEFIVPNSSDRLSALMNKFNKMSSVSGTITPTEVNITVKDMDAFVQEIGLKDQIVGGVLAITKLYDYSYIDPNDPDFLQFTETGFTFHWKAVGSYSLSLDEF